MFLLRVRSKYIFVFVSVWFCLQKPLFSQSIKLPLLIEKVRLSCRQFTEGSYLYSDLYKIERIGEDTTVTTTLYQVSFKRNLADTLSGYQTRSISNGIEKVYSNYVSYNIDHKKNEFKVLTKISDIKVSSYPIFYPFFIVQLNLINLYYNNIVNNSIAIKGQQIYNGEQCYVLELKDVNTNPNRSSQNLIYVSKKSFLPIRHLTTLTTRKGNAVEKAIFDYSVKKALKQTLFSFKNLSYNNYQKKYALKNSGQERDSSELLPIGTIPPNWTLPSIFDNSKVSFDQLRGKLVVLDFWYKACIPCYDQMISLQALKDKYSDKDVEFIGINTIDDPVKDKLSLFLRNRKITMLNLYQGKLIQNEYKVFSYPCLYILDKNGVILYSESTYSQDLLEKVSNIINEKL